MREPPAFWYEPHLLGVLLAPLGWLYALGAALRRGVYRAGVRRSRRAGCPVVVVGNLCVGGTGKTPLVIAVAKLLARHGLRPGIVCRGYGGRSSRWPRHVHSGSDPGLAGDEAVLLARRAAVPVVAGPDRVAASRALCGDTGCDVILSDDGLQHLRLARDVEIVVVDGARRHGNGRCLPAGPLREPVGRLASVDLVVVNGGVRRGKDAGKAEDAGGEAGAEEEESAGEGGSAPDMRLAAGDAVSLADPETTRPLDAFRDAPIHALCGIGHAERFFRTLEGHGLTIVRHPFPDHHPFRGSEIAFSGDAPVLMTEKDAVKCERFAGARHWYVPVEAVLSKTFEARLVAILRKRGVIAMDSGPSPSPEPHRPPESCPFAEPRSSLEPHRTLDFHRTLHPYPSPAPGPPREPEPWPGPPPSPGRRSWPEPGLSPGPRPSPEPHPYTFPGPG